MTTIQKKICLLGDFAVGKTSLVRRYVEGRFDDKYLSTVGVKIARRSLSRAYGTLNLLVWDLAGSDEFTKTAASYLRGAAGALIVCDLTRPETLETLSFYAHMLQSRSVTAPMVFLGNKADLVDERLITAAELQAACVDFGGHCWLTSAKTGEHVEDAFAALAAALEELT